MGSSRVLTRAIAFVKIVILARLLGPSQFGLFGIASLVLAFLEILTETGINAFLVQEEEDIDEYLDTAWTLSIIRGFLISVMIISLAPFVSSFFGFPEAYKLLLLISVVPILRGFINPSIIKFQKDLEFNKEFFFRTPIFLFDAFLAILLAFNLRSASSIVWGMIGGVSLEVFLSWLFVKPVPRLSFETSKFKRIVNRGKWITFTGIFNYLFQQGDDIVVGKLMNEYALGLYQVAYKISTLPITEGSEVFHKVVFPVYVKIRQDKQRLKKAYLKVVLTVAAITIPFGVVMVLFPRQIVLTLLGERWVEIVPVLRVLVIYGVSRAILGTSAPLFLALKKQEYNTLVVFVGLIGVAVTIIPLVKSFGITGAGASALFGLTLASPIVIYLTLKTLKDS